VIAELDAARTSGELDALVAEDSGATWLARQAQPSSLTRQQVRADKCRRLNCAAIWPR
jgi:hypothetical protein